MAFIDLEVRELEGPTRKERVPRMTRHSRAFSCTFSLSPRRSMIPPAGRKAFKACLRVAASMNAEDVEVEAFDKEEELYGLVMRRGRRDGNADSVAIVKSWFAVRIQDLKTLMRESGSSI